MTQKFINNYSTTVAQTFGSGDTYLRVASPVGLPVLGVGEYFLLTVFRKVGQNESGHEVVKVTEVVSDQLTVQRSIEGAATSTFIVGDRVEARLTAGSLDSFTDTAQAAAAAPVQSVAGKTGAVVLVKADVGLANVDNTSDASKPVSTATQTALNAKLSDAPSDGKTYGRKDAAWVEAGGTPVIRTPTIIAPTNASTAIGETPTLTGSPYYSLYSIPMAASQWQVSVGVDFATTVVSTGDVAGTGTMYTLAGGLLSVSTVYYWRVRYKDAEGVYSEWSLPTSFTTAASFNDYIATPTATPSAFGDPMEGGFYAGLIWNELVQTSTSTTIGTGSKSFTVPSMTAAAIVYASQTLEVRSRANPANKMIGTVTGASGTTLTLNITSVGGSGTFTDWSIMSRYRVIVAPKSSGENASIAYKNANTAAPAATGTLSEGRKATLAMVGADTSTVYPAAHWCNNLTIGGKADWYLPARDELELSWRNLKPTTDANYTGADRPSSATPDYKNLGSYGDTANTHGLNTSSNPTGAAYTSGSPTQTVATAFRTGGAEAFEYDSAYYWSSTEYSASDAWGQFWHSSIPGRQDGNGKTNAYHVRAARRSII